VCHLESHRLPPDFPSHMVVLSRSLYQCILSQFHLNSKPSSRSSAHPVSIFELLEKTQTGFPFAFNLWSFGLKQPPHKLQEKLEKELRTTSQRGYSWTSDNSACSRCIIYFLDSIIGRFEYWESILETGYCQMLHQNFRF
jgi:hypothetical protein